MKVVAQRVKRAAVAVEGQEVGAIQNGLLLFVGVGRNDSPEAIEWLARKVAGLRVFADEAGKMNLSLKEVQGACLVVSQFTLFGDCTKGFRPGFSSAAPPEEGNAGFEAFVQALRAHELPVETGVFQADMEVSLVNDGPVTLILEKE